MKIAVIVLRITRNSEKFMDLLKAGENNVNSES